MPRVWASALDSGLETSDLSGTSPLPHWDESGAVLFSARLNAILTLGLLAGSRLAGYQCGPPCLPREVTLCVYFGFVLILSS